MSFLQCLSLPTMNGPAYTTAATFIGLAVLLVWVLQQGSFSGRWRFLLCIAGLLWWLATAFLEMGQPQLQCKLAFAQAAWPGIVIVPVSWFFFLGRYCFGPQWRIGRAERVTTTAVISILPLLAATNHWHHLFYGPDTRLETLDGLTFAVFDHGPLFYMVTVVLYVFLLSSVVIVAAAAFSSPKEHRPSFMVLFVGTLAPVFANVAYNYYDITIFGFDPTPFTFAFVLFVMSWAVFANRMFDLSSLARDIIYLNLGDPVIVINRTNFVVAINPAARRLFPNLDAGVSLMGHLALAAISDVIAAGQNEGDCRFDVTMSDRVYSCRLIPIARPLANRDSLLGYVAILTDATGERQRMEQLEAAVMRSASQLETVAAMLDAAERSALTDPLTRLGNRRALELAMDARGDVADAADAIALIDIDYFKDVNDVLGHTAGDTVLRRFAAELANVLPPGAFAFRGGGEEFVVLQTQGSSDALLSMIQQFAAQIRKHNPLEAYSIPPLTFSAGIAGPPTDMGSVADLYELADARLYEAKRTGRNRIIAAPPSGGQAAAQTTPFQSLQSKSGHRFAEGQRRLAPLQRALLRATKKERDGLVDRALAVLGDHCYADRAYVFLLENGQTVSNTHEWCRDQITSQKDNLQDIPISQLYYWIDLLSNDELIDIPDVNLLPTIHADMRAHLLEQEIRAVLAAPLSDGHRLIGFVGLDAVRPRPAFDRDDIALLRSISDAVALAFSDHDPDVSHSPDQQVHAPIRQKQGVVELLAPNHLGMRNAFLNGVLRTSPAAIVSTDRFGNVIFANNEARELLGLTAAIDGREVQSHPDWVIETEDGQPLSPEAFPWLRVARSGREERDLRYTVRFRDGSRRLVAVNAAPIPHAPMGAEVVFTITDVTEARATADRLLNLALRDPLTNLRNRRGLEEAATELLTAAEHDGHCLAFMLLDLDNFRSVNDVLRHGFGDAVLQVAAKRMQTVVDDTGVVARMGGDEFMVVLPCSDKAFADERAEDLRKAIARPIKVDDHVINLTASIGMALYPFDGKEFSQLITGADIALFAAKRAGRNRTQSLSRRLFMAEERRGTLIQALAALDFETGLKVVLQPQCRLGDARTISGAEVLLRWAHPVLGEVGPAEFIPLAENMGLIQRIDQHVIGLASRQLARWAAMGNDMHLSINISGRSFSTPRFATTLLEQLAADQVNPNRLTVELTETTFVRGSRVASNNIAALRKAGIGLAIDDFGTGYASLSYLQRMDVSEIKIDRSFVAGLNTSLRNESEELIRAIVGLARGLGLTVVAEGVETDAQVEWLEAAGCDAVQGNRVGEPVAPELFTQRYLGLLV